MPLYKLDELNSLHIDVLREIGNIGSGNAATALSSMLDTRVNMTPPEVKILDVNQIVTHLGGAEKAVVAVLARLTGEINGLMIFILEQNLAVDVIQTLLGTESVELKALKDIEKSAISELGNILIASYINSISSLSGLSIKISVPAISIDMVGAILSVPAIELGSASEKIILIEGNYMNIGQDVSADILLIPDIESLNKMMVRLGIENE